MIKARFSNSNMEESLKTPSLAIILILTVICGSGCSRMLSSFHKDVDDIEADTDSGEKASTENKETNRQPVAAQSPSPSPVVSDDDKVDKPLVSSGNNSNVDPEIKREYQIKPRVNKEDFIDHSEDDGSLWASSGQTNYYFTKNRIKSVGDLVNLTIEADLYKEIGEEIKRTLNSRELSAEIELAQDQVRKKFMAGLDANMKKENNAANVTNRNRSPANSPNPSTSPSPEPLEEKAKSTAMTQDQIDHIAPRASLEDIDIFQSLQLKVNDLASGEVLERYSNGNYKVRAIKRIKYKNGPMRLVTIMGIVKLTENNDETDVIKSGDLYEYRVEVSH